MKILATINVTGTDATPVEVARIPKGIKGAGIRFVYGSDWKGLRKNVVFQGAATVAVTDAEDIVKIPLEVVAAANTPISVGVCGLSAAEEEIIPTIWANLGTVWPSASGSFPPPLEEGLPVWAQIQMDVSKLEEEVEKLKNDTSGGPNSGQDTAGGFVAQDTAPEDTSVLWIDTDDDSDDGFRDALNKLEADMKNYVDAAISGIATIPKHKLLDLDVQKSTASVV